MFVTTCLGPRLVVEYDYSPGCKARPYLANGDPGYPAEPAEIEITAVYASKVVKFVETIFDVNLIRLLSECDLETLEERIDDYENSRRDQ